MKAASVTTMAISQGLNAGFQLEAAGPPWLIAASPSA